MAIVTTDSKHYGDIANAIRAKTNKSDTYKPADMAEAIMTIEGGDTPAPVQAKDVNFYDYDGTLLHSYTVAEAQALTELPPLPTQQGLICQKWNYTLASVQATTHKLDVGATYITDDGKTRLYINLTGDYRLSVPLYFSQTVANGVIIDWGDGSATQTLNGTDDVNVTHDYEEEGYYIISLEVIGACELGSGNNTPLFGDSYRLACYKAEIGNGVTGIGMGAFANCYSLHTITIPDSVTSIGIGAFTHCYSLHTITIPDSVTSTMMMAFAECYGLHTITISDSVTSIGDFSLFGCRSLHTIAIPGSVTSIGGRAFANCYSLDTITIPDSVTSIGENALSYCYGLHTITIPDSVTSIGIGAFTGSSFMGGYYFYPTIPPTLSSVDTFNEIPEDCVIHVPAESLSAYQTATNWAAYANYMVGDL